MGKAPSAVDPAPGALPDVFFLDPMHIPGRRSEDVGVHFTMGSLSPLFSRTQCVIGAFCAVLALLFASCGLHAARRPGSMSHTDNALI